jgi:hypothetical protein
MPSRSQPPQAAQKPRIWLEVRREEAGALSKGGEDSVGIVGGTISEIPSRKGRRGYEGIAMERGMGFGKSNFARNLR